MKGSVLNIPTNMIFTLFFVVMVFIAVFMLISNVRDVQVDIVKSSLLALAIVDAAHVTESCLSGGQPIKKENIEEKISACQKKTGVKFVKLTDIETGESWSSGKAGQTAYRLFVRISGAENHIGRLYVTA